MPYTTHRPTARVLDIMQLLSTSKEGCSLTEIATAISVPKSTIVPIIRTLCERRFITQHGSNKPLFNQSYISMDPTSIRSASALSSSGPPACRIWTYWSSSNPR